MKDWHKKAIELSEEGYSGRQIAGILGRSKSQVNDVIKAHRIIVDDTKVNKAKVLVLDIETAPVMAAVWRLFKENIGLNQIDKDWHLLSYAAKWLGEDDIFYSDQRAELDITNDSRLLHELWMMLDEADIVLHQNGKRFDIPKIRARMVIQGFKPFSPVRHIDTLEIAKKTFGFTSNRLEYMTDTLCTDTKKSKHNKFPGFELWKECLAGNEEAWEEMREYNCLDIISLEELYYKVAPWTDKLPNFSLYTDEIDFACQCGSTSLVEKGFAYTEVSKFQRYVCADCGKHYRGRKNLLSKGKRDKLLTHAREV